MKEYKALIGILSTFKLRFARKSTLGRILGFPGLTSSTLSRASCPSRPRIVFSIASFHQSKLVNIKQESRAVVDELSALVALHIGVASDEVIHLCSVIFLRMALTR